MNLSLSSALASRRCAQSLSSASLVALLQLACTSSWGGPLAQGVSAYEDARYAEASRYFALAAPLQGPPRPTRLLLYAGLNYLALGDARRGAQCLSWAQHQFKSSPSTLTEHERSQLALAWHALGSMPGHASPLSLWRGIAPAARTCTHRPGTFTRSPKKDGARPHLRPLAPGRNRKRSTTEEVSPPQRKTE